ncbi:hypothetical protein EMCG_01882 [[Emmonsia] crescens]|uniref:PH domain-containing protein n=1 Tax=[Emmonsia] crescens TaxID=73230 RepID=A0A0G2I073_9EURO|nr:hypothetical protein EMCG_01882 [Emmonsia crescens UAMH 3008]
MRSRCVKQELHRRRSLAGLFTSPPPQEPDQDKTNITCKERIHYPLYNPRDPRHNSDAFAGDINAKGFWASYGRSIRSRLHGSIKSGAQSPNFQQQKPRRSIRSGFASLTGSSRLMKRFSRSEKPSKPHLSSIWEPQSPSQISRHEVASNLLPGHVENSQLSYFPEALSVPRPYLLPSLPSMSSGLMSALELEACTAAGYTEQETSYIQHYDTRPHTFRQPLQPFHILRNAVSSMSNGQPIIQARPGYTNISNSSELLGAQVPSVQDDRLCTNKLSVLVSENGSSPIPITPKRPPLNRQQARVVNERDNANLSTLLNKQMHSHSSALDNQKKEDESKTPEKLTNITKPQSLLNLGEQWLETRKQPLRVVSPGISQPSTATDSEFGVGIYRTSAKHRYALTTESDAVLSSWLSSLSSVSHTRDNTDISGSTLCHSPPPSTGHLSAKQTGSFPTSALRWQDRSVTRSSRSETRYGSGLVINNKDAWNEHEEASSKSNPPRPRITTESTIQEKPGNPSFVRNIRPDVGRPFEVPKAPLNLHLNLADNPSQLSNSLREQLCESDLETEANEGAFCPDSIDTRVERGNLNQLPKDNSSHSPVLGGHDIEGHGKVEFVRECQSIPVSHAEENRAPSYSGNAKVRNVSQGAANRIRISACKTSYTPCVEPTADCGPGPRERTGSHAAGDRGSKSSSSRKDGSSSGSGSGSGGSGQSDPLTNSTAGTSVVDFASDQNLTTKTKAEEHAGSPEMDIKTLPSKDDAVLLKN